MQKSKKNNLSFEDSNGDVDVESNWIW